MTNKLVQFTLMIPIDHRRREFNFRQRNESLYDGNTVDAMGDRFYFTMVKEADQWKFADTNLPVWLKNIETQVVTVFGEEHS